MISRRFRGAAVSFSPRERGGMLIRRAANAKNSLIGGIARRGLAPSARHLRGKHEWRRSVYYHGRDARNNYKTQLREASAREVFTRGFSKISEWPRLITRRELPLSFPDSARLLSGNCSVCCRPITM